MRAPRLTRTLTLEREQRLSDGAGGYLSHWEGLGCHWAEVVAGAGRAQAGEEITRSAVSYRVTVRAFPPDDPARPKAGQRFREGARIFSIVAVAERDAGGRYLICHCREETPL